MRLPTFEQDGAVLPALEPNAHTSTRRSCLGDRAAGAGVGQCPVGRCDHAGAGTGRGALRHGRRGTDAGRCALDPCRPFPGTATGSASRSGIGARARPGPFNPRRTRLGQPHAAHRDTGSHLVGLLERSGAAEKRLGAGCRFPSRCDLSPGHGAGNNHQPGEHNPVSRPP